LRSDQRTGASKGSVRWHLEIILLLSFLEKLCVVEAKIQARLPQHLRAS
jgi:hypothetical protein